MSRSRRHNPVRSATTVESDKHWKRLANRQLRHHAKATIIRTAMAAPDRLIIPAIEEVADVWKSQKDGKCRFDPIKYPDMMRK